MGERVATDQWNLICAGPSMAHLRREHLLDGAVVSVNRAIQVAERGIDVDYAAFSDRPELIWGPENLSRFWKPPMVLWVSGGCEMQKVKSKAGDEVMVPGLPLAKRWDLVLDSCIGFRVMPHGEVPDTEVEGKRRVAFTTLCALKKILHYRPKAIRILCMDLAGSWIEGVTAETCEASSIAGGFDRWKHERATMERHINQIRGDHGVRIECVIPEPAEEALDGAIVH